MEKETSREETEMEDRPSYKVEGCVFCQGSEVMTLYEGSRVPEKRWSCHCHRCGAEGPGKATEREAIEAWNSPVDISDLVVRYKNQVLTAEHRQNRAYSLVRHAIDCLVDLPKFDVVYRRNKQHLMDREAMKTIHKRLAGLAGELDADLVELFDFEDLNREEN